MVIHTLQCAECRETRPGRDTDDGIEPIQTACPNCGTTEYARFTGNESSANGASGASD